MSASDWDLFWRHERLHRRRAPVDFRRWKRASQSTLRALFPGSAVRVLDATAGLGDHTVNLAELGFLVEACDASAEARAATTEAVRAAGLDVTVFDARWERLGEVRPGRYDLIFNDAIHWLEGEGAMHEALIGTRAALAPGGALVFFFADPERPAEGAGLEILEWDRAHLAAHALEWDHPTGETGGRVTHLRIASAAERHIDEHHVWVTRDAHGDARLEGTVLRRIYAWDWHAMSRALARAGYEAPIGRHFVNDKGHRSAMCLAHRPR